MLPVCQLAVRQIFSVSLNLILMKRGTIDGRAKGYKVRVVFEH